MNRNWSLSISFLPFFGHFRDHWVIFTNKWFISINVFYIFLRKIITLVKILWSPSWVTDNPVKKKFMKSSRKKKKIKILSMTFRVKWLLKIFLRSFLYRYKTSPSGRYRGMILPVQMILTLSGRHTHSGWLVTHMI